MLVSQSQLATHFNKNIKFNKNENFKIIYASFFSFHLGFLW